MKVKTSELIDQALDWAVAKREGADIGIISPGWVVKADYSVFGRRRLLCPLEEGGEFYSPSTYWSVGGPIIEREGISVKRGNDIYFPKGNELGNYYETLWLASTNSNVDTPVRDMFGQTILIAAMRAYVASRMGEEIDVPDELL